MRNLIDELLEMDTPYSKRGLHPTGCKCPLCTTNTSQQEYPLRDEIPLEEFSLGSFWDWLFPSSSSKSAPLTSTKIQSAVAYNRRKRKSLGWDKHLDAISKLIGFSGPKTDEQGFAKAVALWQANNGYSGRNVDGKLGKGTWGKMQTVLGISTSRFRGPLKLVNTPMPSGPTHILPNPNRSYAVPDTIKAIEWIAREWHKRHPNVRVRIGDFSKKGGGKFGGHKSHRIGLDTDISLVVKPGRRWRRIGNHKRKNPSSLMVKDYKPYQHLAKYFVELILSNPIMKVKTIYFFDHTLHSIIRNTKTSRNHYRHFHVRFCMPAKYKSQLLLSSVYKGKGRRPSYWCP